MPPRPSLPIAIRARRCPPPSVWCALLVAAALGLLATPASTQTRPPEPTVSLNVKDRPLGDVLALISRATGCEFLLDPSWQKVPVTANVENAPLSVALKRVLSGLNHAIVYQPQNRVKIVIYETAPPGATPGMPPGLSPTAPLPARPPQPGIAPARRPEAADPLRTPPPEPPDAAPAADEDAAETAPQS
jgi:hypothetical protein